MSQEIQLPKYCGQKEDKEIAPGITPLALIFKKWHALDGKLGKLDALLMLLDKGYVLS